MIVPTILLQTLPSGILKPRVQLLGGRTSVDGSGPQITDFEVSTDLSEDGRDCGRRRRWLMRYVGYKRALAGCWFLNPARLHLMS